MPEESASHLPRVGESLKYDLPAGLVVYLVAVPLCLGIALASGAPLISGLITGIVGGCLVSWISGSQLSVSGPAAGLAIICLTSIQEIGSFEGFLTAVVLAGVFQIIFGLLRLGFVAEFVPTSVIRGMLAAIGIVIILKQIPHALGRDKDFEGNLDYKLPGGEGSTLSEIAVAVQSLHPTALLISLSCIALLLLWDGYLAKKTPRLKMIPGPLLAVLLGSAIVQLSIMKGGDFAFINREHNFVNLPVFSQFADLLHNLPRPDWGRIFEYKVVMVALTLAVVASLETLLSVEATDKLDPFRRISSTNRELLAQGIGNSIAGVLGGIPMTAVIVRSSANVYAGGRTRFSAFIHGVLIAITVLLVPWVLNQVPLASLAAVLCVVGYKLANVTLFKQMFQAGMDQFIPFVVTVVTIVFTDLLTGVLAGMCVGLYVVLRTSRVDAIAMVHEGKDFLIRFNKDATFIHKSVLKSRLSKIPDGSSVIIDGSKAAFVDKDIFDIIDDFEAQAEFRGITVELKQMNKPSLPFFLSKGHTHGVVQEATFRQPGLGSREVKPTA